jgi:exoribonuclease R
MLSTTNYQAFQIIQHHNNAAEQVLHSFDGPQAAARALVGDFVEWNAETQQCALVNRTIHPPLTGLLDICSKTIYGMTSRHVPIFLFYPFDKRYPPMRVGCSTSDRSINLLVKVRFESWESGETFPRANLENVIGPVGNIVSEARALVSFASPFWRSKITYSPPVALTTDHQQLEDAAAWHIFHIDPVGCRDVDDIIGIRPRTDGKTDFLIGISDVAAYISEDSVLDLVARHNSSTVYTLGGSAVAPMFPAALSEELFSLSPSSSLKPVIALQATYDGNAITDVQFKELLVQVQQTYTYEDVYSRAPAYVCETLSSLAATIARRIAGPAAILDVRKITIDSHTWIEQLMVFYNLETAALIAPSERAILRKHDAADPAAIDAVSILPEELRWIVSKPAEYVSISSTQAPIHSSFHAMYCHASSPIRRYTDLHNQRVLKAIIHDTIAAAPKLSSHLIAHLNQRQKTFKQYQRNLTFITQILEGPPTAIVEATVVAIGDSRGIASALSTSIAGGDNRGIASALSTSIAGGNVKATLWIPAWKTLVKTLEYDGLYIGDKLSLRFYYNPNRPNWKERIVFERVA